jgi:hypothetical protein
LRILARAEHAREEGQALVLVLIMMMILVLVIPIVVSQVTSEDVSVGQDSNFEAALAAAEAGVQQYQNLLDTDADYWRYSASNPPPASDGADPALQLNGWQTVSLPKGDSNAVPEAFHYSADAEFTQATQQNSNLVLLTVTGRAGATPATYQYRTIQTTLQPSGLLTNAYYSQYEVLDPRQDTAQFCAATSGCTSASSANIVTLTENGNQVGAWTALCQYDTYVPNTYIDSQGITNPFHPGGGSTTFNSTTPYYGPYRGNDPNSGSNSFSTFSSSGGKLTTTDPCGTPYNFQTNENFNGPVSSKDQLWLCGNPDFAQGLTSGVGKNFSYSANETWPTQNGTASGTNGWIDNGELDWGGSCGGNFQSYPTFGGNGLQQVPSSSEDLPPLTNAILNQAAQGGCLFQGPTMIQFLPTGDPGNVQVWSPLSPSNPGAQSGATCGTGYSPSSPSATFTLPSTGLVMYVEDATAAELSQVTTTDFNSYMSNSLPASANDPSGALPGAGSETDATCLNPWKPYYPASSCTTNGINTEGDAVVEGELGGDVTVGSAANIVISRDITYYCTGGPSGQTSSSFNMDSTSSSCRTSHQDVLGLAANNDVLVGHPGPIMSTTTAVSVASGGNDNVSNGVQTEPYEWPAWNNFSNTNSDGTCADNGTSTTQTIANVVPDCEIANPVIDAAVVALNGAFAAEDYDMGNTDGYGGQSCAFGSGPDLCGIYLEGTDISDYRGPVGCSSNSQYCNAAFGSGGNYEYGYAKEYSYDLRLNWLTPPSLNDVASLIWTETSFIDCGDANDQSNPSTLCKGLA